jgi:hypothetical protein
MNKKTIALKICGSVMAIFPPFPVSLVPTIGAKKDNPGQQGVATNADCREDPIVHKKFQHWS